MKLSARETLLLMLVLAAAVCAGYYNYVYVPVTAEIAAGDAELARLQMEHSRLLVWKAEAPQTEQRILDAQEELDGWISDARVVADAAQVLLFLEEQSGDLDIRLSSVDFSTGQMSLAFDVRDYLQSRLFLSEMEKLMAFEVLRVRYASATTINVGLAGTFDVALHIGAADPEIGSEPTDRVNPFAR